MPPCPPPKAGRQVEEEAAEVRTRVLSNPLISTCHQVMLQDLRDEGGRGGVHQKLHMPAEQPVPKQNQQHFRKAGTSPKPQPLDKPYTPAPRQALHPSISTSPTLQHINMPFETLGGFLTGVFQSKQNLRQPFHTKEMLSCYGRELPNPLNPSALTSQTP